VSAALPSTKSVNHFRTRLDLIFPRQISGVQKMCSSWAGEIFKGITTITVCAAQPEVEHQIKIAAFKTWVNRPGGSPAEKIQRGRIREILGL
jgi:hypothetical protein